MISDKQALQVVKAAGVILLTFGVIFTSMIEKM